MITPALPPPLLPAALLLDNIAEAYENERDKTSRPHVLIGKQLLFLEGHLHRP